MERDGRSWMRFAPSGSAWRGAARACLALSALLVAGCAEGADATAAERFEAKAQWAVESFDAPVMTQQRLRELLEGDEAGDVLLVDTRSPEEYRVSRLPGAVRWSDFKAGPPPTEVLERAKAGRPVVFYCSIGYRSGLAAERVAKQVGSDRSVYNLKGGIFQWANEGRPLEGGPLVHGYDEQWGRLLRPDRRAAIE